jgi:hypothetical protein
MPRAVNPRRDHFDLGRDGDFRAERARDLDAHVTEPAETDDADRR